MPNPEKFRESLAAFHVDRDTIDAVYAGCENLVSRSPRAQRAAFFRRAVALLDERLPPNTVREVLAWNACCKSGAREKASREFARINKGLSLAEKLAKIAKAPYMNMGVPSLEPDGALRIDAVSYVYEGRFECGCTNFKRLKRDYAVSRSYCHCCGGHFQYHYQIMLGVRLEQAEVVSTPLDSEGASPCVFRFTIAE